MGKKDSNVGTDAQVTTEAPEAPVVEEHAPEVSEATPPAVAPSSAEAPGEIDESPVEKDPGKTLGIVAIVGSLALGLLGIALGLVSYRRSRAAGFSGGLGMAGIILGSVTTVLLALQLILLATGMGFGGACEGLAPGVHTLDNGTRVSCR